MTRRKITKSIDLFAFSQINRIIREDVDMQGGIVKNIYDNKGMLTEALIVHLI